MPAAALLCGVCAGAAAQGFDPEARRQAQAEAYAEDIQERLRGVPGVAQVRARVRLPSPFEAPLDGAPAPLEAHVVTTLAAGGRNEAPPSPSELARLASLTAPGLDASHVTVHLQGPRPPVRPPLAHVGPFEASPRSAPWLRLTLAILLTTTLVMGALLMRYARKRMRRKKLSPLSPRP